MEEEIPGHLDKAQAHFRWRAWAGRGVCHLQAGSQAVHVWQPLSWGAPWPMASPLNWTHAGDLDFVCCELLLQAAAANHREAIGRGDWLSRLLAILKRAKIWKKGGVAALLIFAMNFVFFFLATKIPTLFFQYPRDVFNHNQFFSHNPFYYFNYE